MEVVNDPAWNDPLFCKGIEEAEAESAAYLERKAREEEAEANNQREIEKANRHAAKWREDRA